MSGMRDYWSYDAIQFPRLIAEIDAMEPPLNDHQIDQIVATTRLLPGAIGRVVRKAVRNWEEVVRLSSGLKKKRWLVPETIKLDRRFARLLYGIYQSGLSQGQWAFLMESMDLPLDGVKELFSRAADAYEKELEI